MIRVMYEPLRFDVLSLFPETLKGFTSESIIGRACEHALIDVQSLDLRNNAIKDPSFVAGYTELQYLLLDDNKITDLSVLVTMGQKDLDGQKRFAPFWNIHLSGNPLGAKAKQEQLAALKKQGARLTFKKQRRL